MHTTPHTHTHTHSGDLWTQWWLCMFHVIIHHMTRNHFPNTSDISTSAATIFHSSLWGAPSAEQFNVPVIWTINWQSTFFYLISPELKCFFHYMWKQFWIFYQNLSLNVPTGKTNGLHAAAWPGHDDVSFTSEYITGPIVSVIDHPY